MEKPEATPQKETPGSIPCPVNDCDRLGYGNAKRTTFCESSQAPVDPTGFYTMKITDVFSTNYAVNVVTCKLWGLTGSPTESILTLALFNKLCHFYDGWTCRVYSEHEYRQVLAEQKINSGSFVLVPQWSVNQVGLVDLAVFIPGLDHRRPVVVVECDGHHFHERTPEQASKDRRRVRILQRLGIGVLPFTGTDVVRSSEDLAQEIVEFIDARVSGMERRWLLERGIDPEDANSVSFAVPYPWPRTHVE